MKKIILLFALFCFSHPGFSEFENPSFETITNCEFDSESVGGAIYYPYAFRDLCLGSHWKCYSGSPDIRVGNSVFGQAFDGTKYVHLFTQAINTPDALKEGIYYEGFNFECGIPYNFSMAVKGFESDIEFQVKASDYLDPRCEELPDETGGGLGQFIIESEFIEASDDWVIITVENFVFDCDYYDSNSTDIFILPLHANSENESGDFLIDAISFAPAPCEPISCSEKTDLTACSEEGDFGYVILECEGANSYEWEFPSGSNPIEMTCGNASVVLNAGEGSYNVTITGDYGCTEEREYEISPDCCDCPVPDSLGCVRAHSKIKLFWSEIPNATYEITIKENDIINCGCFWGGTVDTTIVSDLPNNWYYINPNLYSCFSWTVSAICENGLESDNSLTYCYQDGECYSYEQFHNEEDQSDFKSSLKPKIYPNPSSNSLNFELSTPGELELEVSVFDLNGKLVKNFAKETYIDGNYTKRWSIDNQLSDGIYLVFFKTNYGTFQEKVIISKNGFNQK